MKKTRFNLQGLLAPVVTLIFGTVFISAGLLEQGRKDTIITVTVDAKNITQDNILDYVSLSDNQGGSGSSPTDYTTPVDPGKRITWEGKTLDPASEQKIIITRIRVKGDGDPAVLKKRSYAGNGRVRGNARNANSGVDAYNITFKIVGGQRQREFTFDPKIKIKSS